ncbi:MAG: hypothetical protein NTX59_09885 [Elusimicrobia bacterium]|nr:hypothetical protein [Elusimicrobiota bacterium]
MTETEHKSFFRTLKVLTLLPLVLMAAGVWYYIAKHNRTGPAPDNAGLGANAERGREDPKARRPARGWQPGGQAPDTSPAAAEAALDIQGDENFKSQVTHSLKLIWLSDREDFLFIKKYLAVIRNEDKTDLYFDGDGRPVAALSSAQAGRSLTWCAGLIAHQAFHSYIKFNSKKGEKMFRPPLPGEKDERKFSVNLTPLDYTSLDEILDVEAKACSFQAEILRKIGAPKSEINSLRRRAPRDFSVSHDGNYSIKP